VGGLPHKSGYTVYQLAQMLYCLQPKCPYYCWGVLWLEQ